MRPVAPFFMPLNEREKNMTLDQLKPGDHACVKKLSCRDRLGQRLIGMGMYPGMCIRVIRNAPLEDPMEIEMDGCFISLRHEEARFVEVCF
jgi:ferrous iron transport protein A